MTKGNEGRSRFGVRLRPPVVQTGARVGRGGDERERKSGTETCDRRTDFDRVVRVRTGPELWPTGETDLTRRGL